MAGSFLTCSMFCSFPGTKWILRLFGFFYYTEVYALRQCGSIWQKYCCKDIFWIVRACKTLVNNQFNLSHNCLLYRESNSWRKRKPSNCFLTERRKCRPQFWMFTKCLHATSDLLCASKHRRCDTTALYQESPETSLRDWDYLHSLTFDGLKRINTNLPY